jgi:hypothetical protein
MMTNFHMGLVRALKSKQFEKLGNSETTSHSCRLVKIFINGKYVTLQISVTVSLYFFQSSRWRLKHLK